MTLGLFIAGAGVVLAVALAGIGSAIGIGYAGTVAAGAMSEDPKNFGRFLPLVVLPGTQGIYGFVIGMLVIINLGVLKGEVVKLTTIQGINMFIACMPIALSGLFSAIHQGKVCASGIETVAKQPKEMGKVLVMGILVEFYAVLGLIVSFFMVNAFSKAIK